MLLLYSTLLDNETAIAELRRRVVREEVPVRALEDNLAGRPVAVTQGATENLGAVWLLERVHFLAS
jgi:hypothetical protein